MLGGGGPSEAGPAGGCAWGSLKSQAFREGRRGHSFLRIFLRLCCDISGDAPTGAPPLPGGGHPCRPDPTTVPRSRRLQAERRGLPKALSPVRRGHARWVGVQEAKERPRAQAPRPPQTHPARPPQPGQAPVSGGSFSRVLSATAAGERGGSSRHPSGYPEFLPSLGAPPACQVWPRCWGQGLREIQACRPGAGRETTGNGASV